MPDSGSNAIGQALINGSENGKLSRFNFITLDIFEVTRYVAHIHLPLLVIPDFSPQGARLFKVKLGDLA